MRKITKRTLAIAAAAVIGVGAMGTAWAFYTANGSGSGSASAANKAALSITATVASELYPGASGNLDVTITNPNAYPVNVTSVALGTGGVASNTPGCEEFVNLSAPAITTSISVPGKTGNTPGSAVSALTGAVVMSTTAGDECAGATFTIPLSITGSQTV